MKHFKIAFMLLCLISLFSAEAQAQFLGGFFSQQAQKKKVMMTQIAGYEVYLKGVKTAYHIADKGLTTAHDLKNGTVNLHSSYISSLGQVTPAVRDHPKGKAIAGLQQQVIDLFSTEIAWQQRQKLLNAGEIGYLQKVSATVQAKARLDMDELRQVLIPGKLQLTDTERLQRIDHLYEAMRDKQAFTAYFTAKCRKLALARKEQQKDKAQMRKLYGIQ